MSSVMQYIFHAIQMTRGLCVGDIPCVMNEVLILKGKNSNGWLPVGFLVYFSIKNAHILRGTLSRDWASRGKMGEQDVWCMHTK